MKTHIFARTTHQRFETRLPARSSSEDLRIELRPEPGQSPEELRVWLAGALIARPQLLPFLQQGHLTGAGFMEVADKAPGGPGTPDALIFQLNNELVESGHRQHKAFRAGESLVIQGSAAGTGPAAILLHRIKRTPPPVKITYDVETGGAIEKRELPFVIGILADLSGDKRPETPFKRRTMVEIDRDNFDEVLQVCRPGVDLSALDNLLPGAVAPKLAGILSFEKLADFDAAAVAARIPELSALFGTPEGQATGSRQLSLILQSPAFQALEATWRSLNRLVSRTETGKLLKLRVLNASRQDLLDDLAKAVAFDQSGFFKLIYEAEYGTYGGTPYSLLVGAYEFGRDAASIEGLKMIAEVASAAHAPFIAAAAPGLFGLPSFTDLPKPRTLAKIFETDEHIGWRAFCESEEARYVALALPRALMRIPSGFGGISSSTPDFREQLSDGDDTAAPPRHERLLWGNPAFLLAECIAGAFARNRWPARFRGVESGGLLTGLPCFHPDNAAVGTPQVGPTELPITDRRLLELDALGFVALCQRKDTDQATFFCARSTIRPRSYISDEANAAAQLSATLPFILTTSRFAHYIKVIMREKVGSFLTRGNVEAYLNTWISKYVLLDDKAPEEIRAAYPLAAASITVTDTPGQPGAYRATVFLRPTFQLPELTTATRIVADLPS